MRRFVKILEGNTFVVTDGTGDIEPLPGNPTGLFRFDTRFVSKWRLTVNGRRLSTLASEVLEYYEARYFLVPGLPMHNIDAKASVIRRQSVGRGSFEEELTILNHSHETADFTVRFEIGNDFADLLELTETPPKKGTHEARVEDGRLRLSYRRRRFHRESHISTTGPAAVDEGSMTYRVRIGPNGSWTTLLRVEALVLAAGGRDIRDSVGDHAARTRAEIRQDLAEWVARAPHLRCEYRPLTTAYERSIVDLAALRFSPLAYPDQSMLAAGLPWFMTIFGRDSIIASMQALPFAPQLAATTLRLLGLHQGSYVDDFRDEEPGKILLEFRYGETAAFEEQPHSPYFGTADSTPLFLILLDEYERWSGDAALVREFEPEARAALNWIDEYADLMGNGYIWYRRRNEKSGLENQCWKTSRYSIAYRDGRLPGLPRATCELQGYAYDAKVRAARLAREFWDDPAYADQLEKQAAGLKERFNRDFWIEDGEYYALALDGDGGQVDALSSNIGHLLWSGIVEESRAKKVAEHLLGPRLFSGWGVRCLAPGQGRYNPVGYHEGTVWPFDNSLIAWGLRRYGFREESARVADGIIGASQYFEGRLPEVFAGYDRELTKYPVPYPTACSPHAWATGSTLLLLRTMLGLESYGGRLVADPAVPTRMGRIELLDIRGRWGRVDAFARGRIDLQPEER